VTDGCASPCHQHGAGEPTAHTFAAGAPDWQNAEVTTTTIDHRHVARLLATGRVGLGAFLLLHPKAARSWLGDVVDEPGGRVDVRSLAIRDLVLGAGVLRALDRGDSLRPWLTWSVIFDSTDALVTIAASRRLGASSLGAVLLAAGSAAASAVGLSEED
jgi:hypothetical protein